MTWATVRVMVHGLSGHRIARNLVKVVLALFLLVGVASLPSSAAEGQGYPELPQFPGQGVPDITAGSGALGLYITPQAAGVNYLKKAKQWVRTPTLQTVAFNEQTQTLKDPTCKRITVVPGAREIREYKADLTFVNTAAAVGAGDRFGETQSFEARALAFGAIPVQATVAIEQPRSRNGTVVPAVLKQNVGQYCRGYGPFQTKPVGTGATDNYSVFTLAAELTSEVAVRVDALTVDGVSLKLRGACRANGGQLAVTSTRFDDWDPSLGVDDRPRLDRIMTTRLFNVGAGGYLFGTIDIPQFSGCLTVDGEDVSRLLTATVSGPGNRLELRSQGLSGERLEPGEDQFSVCPWAYNCAVQVPPLPVPTTGPEG